MGADEMKLLEVSRIGELSPKKYNETLAEIFDDSN